MIRDKTLIIIAIIGLLIVSFLFLYVKKPEINQIPKNLRKEAKSNIFFHRSLLKDVSEGKGISLQT